MAVVGVEATTTSSTPFEGVDERVAFGLRFPDDVVESFSASFTGYADSSLTVHGTEGEFVLEDAFVTRRKRRLVVDRGSRTTFEGVGRNEVREEFDYFAHCVLTGTTPEPDGHDGLRDVRVMDAAYESAAAGEPVDLKPRRPGRRGGTRGSSVVEYGVWEPKRRRTGVCRAPGDPAWCGGRGRC